VLNINTFLGLFFTLFLFPEGGMVGKRAASIWVYIEFIAARLPTLQIRCEKKSHQNIHSKGRKRSPSLKLLHP